MLVSLLSGVVCVCVCTGCSECAYADGIPHPVGAVTPAWVHGQGGNRGSQAAGVCGCVCNTRGMVIDGPENIIVCNIGMVVARVSPYFSSWS